MTTPSEKKISEFIAAVSKPQLEGMFNPWSQACPTERDPTGYLARRERFRAHMNSDAKVVLIGEAPGYQGCRYSGIAFTSERLLLEGQIPGIELPERITDRNRPWSEPSATIVWGALHELGIADKAVLFNAVPWHPMGKNGIHSNRTPTPDEKAAGLPYLSWFLGLYPDAFVVALGNTAAENLDEVGVEYTKVRHPANGGATKFREGIRELLK